MRRIVAVLLVGALAACGDDDDDGGGGGGGTALTATGGNPAVPVTATNGVTVSFSAACPDPDPSGLDESYSIAALTIAASSFANTCSVLQAGDDKANSEGAVIIVARGVPGVGGTSVTPGTYTIGFPSGSLLDFRFADAFVGRSGAACAPAGDAFAVSGSVTIDSVSGGRARGSVSASLDNGGTLSGTFDAPACTVSFGTGDVCAFEFDPPAGGTCQP